MYFTVSDDAQTFEEAYVSKDEYEEWLALHTTQAMFKLLENAKREVAEMLNTGKTLHENADTTAQHTAKNVGILEGIALVLEMEYSDNDGGEEENEHNPDGVSRTSST